MKRAALALAAAATACSCWLSGGLSGARYDEQVEEPTRRAIAEMDASLDRVIRDEDAAALLDLVPEGFRSKWGGEDAVRPLLKQIHTMEGDSTPSPWHLVEASIRAIGPMMFTIPPPDLNDPQGFVLRVDSVRDREIVSLRNFDHGTDRYVVATIWIREGDGWGLYGFRVGLLRMAGNDAAGWIEEAKRFRERGRPGAALLRAWAAGQVLQPVPYMQYTHAAEIKRAIDELVEESAPPKSWPRRVGAGDGARDLIGLSSISTPDGLVGLVKFLTPLDVRDEAAQNADARRIHPEVLSEFPGLCDGIPKVVYFAYEEIPSDPKKTYLYFATPVACATSDNPSAAVTSETNP